MYNYNYYYSRLYDVFKLQGREEQTEYILDNLIDKYGFEKACKLVIKLYEQVFN